MKINTKLKTISYLSNSNRFKRVERGNLIIGYIVNDIQYTFVSATFDKREKWHEELDLSTGYKKKTYYDYVGDVEKIVIVKGDEVITIEDHFGAQKKTIETKDKIIVQYAKGFFIDNSILVYHKGNSIYQENVFYDNGTKKSVRFREYVEDNFPDLQGPLHREDGPASIDFYNDGELQHVWYYINGDLHREDGPASIWYVGKDKLESYYLYGKRVEEDKFENQVTQLRSNKNAEDI